MKAVNPQRVNLISVLILCLGLAACGEPSVEDLMEDPDKLAEVTQECMSKMMQGQEAQGEVCKNAMEAQKRMMGNMMKGMQEMMQQFKQTE